jgi:hypothetical protein
MRKIRKLFGKSGLHTPGLNAANWFARSWKHDFYGDKYDKMLKIKEKYDPTESLWAYSGVGSDKSKYDLHSGLLCQAGK